MQTPTKAKEQTKLVEVSQSLARRLKKYARHKRREAFIKDMLEKERDSILSIVGSEKQILSFEGEKLASVLNFPQERIDSKAFDIFLAKLQTEFKEIYTRLEANKLKVSSDVVQLRAS
jgi:light-regulated signal transduction histidine kinase (bacteriophytochrome)